MNVLICEDDAVARKLMSELLSEYGNCDTTPDGTKAITAFKQAYQNGNPYNLVCLDIMLPDVDGHQVLAEIREFEKQQGVGPLDGTKVVMATAVDDASDVISAYKSGCEGYVVKPISKESLVSELVKLKLVDPS